MANTVQQGSSSGLPKEGEKEAQSKNPKLRRKKPGEWVFKKVGGKGL